MRKVIKYVLMIFMMFSVISCDNALESNDVESSSVEFTSDESSSIYDSSNNLDSSTVVDGRAHV